MENYTTAARAASRAENSPPVEFDPAVYPIIARHWFGLRPVGEVAAEVVADLKFQRRVERLCRRPRLVGELLAELGAESALRHVIDRKLEQYADLDPDILAATGGDRMPPVPLHRVPR